MAFLSLTLAFALTLCARAALIQQTWEIDYSFVSPDGVEKAVPVVNQQMPGPTLRATVGDHVRITVVNRMPSESTSIHWHGIKQIGTPWSDGVPGITQCAIAPGDSFTYEFMLDAPGTLWWHSHSALQKGSLYGLIIINGDENYVPRVSRDIELLLSDWYHASSIESITGLRQRLPNSFRWPGKPQTLTIQGRGVFNCTKTTRKCDHAEPHVINVEPATSYRLRIVGAASLSHVSLTIDAHTMRVVEAESTLTRPLNVRHLDVGSSTSYSAILTTFSRRELDRVAPGHNGLFWVQTNVRHRQSGARGLAILRYAFAARNATRPAHPPREDWPARDDVRWSLAQARAFKARAPVSVPLPDRRFVFLGTQNRASNGALVWSVNNVSYIGQATPLMYSAKFNIREETDEWREETRIPVPFNYSQTLAAANLSIMARQAPHVIRVRRGAVVEVVLQNTVSMRGTEEIHPWHLHMHNMWVVGFGDHHTTWSEKDVASYDVASAVHRNTAILYPQSWTAFRFVADNPGLAFFHCHILAHLNMGMGLVFQIGDSFDIPAPPAGTPSCGLASKVPLELMPGWSRGQ